jgi:hypothetical protein
MVFDYIKVTFKMRYEWLAFIFNLKSFKATADAFEALLQTAGSDLTVI